MTHAFEEIRFEPGRSDPDRIWCLSIKQPLASLICEGGARGVVKKVAPPLELLGRVLVIHAGQGDYTLRSFSDAAEFLTARHFSKTPKQLRARLGSDGVVHGAIIGEARLVAGMVIGQTVAGRTHASVLPRDRGGPYSGGRHCGMWADFDGVYGLLGDVLPGRWVWGFESVRAYADPEPFKGFGGVFDLGKGRSIRQSQARKLADEARRAEDAGRRDYGQ